MFLLQVRTKHDNGIWGNWLPHSAYATEQEVQEVCYTDVIDGQQWKYIKLSNQIQSGSTTDLKTVWLKTGTVVKILDGSRQGYIGEINDTPNNFLVSISVKKQVEIPNCNYIVLAMVARDIESRYFSCSAKVHNSDKPHQIINGLVFRHESQYIKNDGNYGLKSHSTEIAATRSAIKLMEISQKEGGPK